MNWIKLFTILFVVEILISCGKEVQPLKEGPWRGIFKLTNIEIPFLFEVSGQTIEKSTIFLVNGADRFQLNNLVYRHDSVFIPVDLYDAVLKAKIEHNTLDGRFVKLGGEKPDPGIPFTAKFGKVSRFPESSEKSEIALDGTWEVLMGSGDAKENTVANFQQNMSYITGTILTTTGDYRFLEGSVAGKKFQLSTFGGSTPYLLKGEFNSDSTFTAEFITPRRSTPVSGKRNAEAALPDGYEVTKLRDGFQTIQFSFPNLEGKAISLLDEKYKGKVVIVTILGSWCPNCLDENAYLAQWYKENKQRGVEIIGLGFERKDDFEFARKSLTNLKNRLDIQYEILFAGQSGKDNASKALPTLNGIASFPTTIFIDKKGNVRKVHSGFNGPATGKFYEEFKAEFNQLINQLLAEK